MLIAEDLLLLLTNDRTGEPITDCLGEAVGGAILMELQAIGAVRLVGPQRSLRRARIFVRNYSGIGDDLLDEALRQLIRQSATPTLIERVRSRLTSTPAVARIGLRPQDAVSILSPSHSIVDPQPELSSLYERLAQRGFLRPQHSQVRTRNLRLERIHINKTCWPAANSDYKNWLRATLHAQLVNDTVTDERSRALITLLSMVERLHEVLDAPVPELSVPKLKRRGKSIARGHPLFRAVKRTIERGRSSRSV